MEEIVAMMFAPVVVIMTAMLFTAVVGSLMEFVIGFIESSERNAD